MNIEYVENVINYSTPVFVRNSVCAESVWVQVWELLACAKGETAKLLISFERRIQIFCPISAFVLCPLFSAFQMAKHLHIEAFFYSILWEESRVANIFIGHDTLSFRFQSLIYCWFARIGATPERTSAAEPDIACALPIKSNAISSTDTPFFHSFCLRSPLSSATRAPKCSFFHVLVSIALDILRLRQTKMRLDISFSIWRVKGAEALMHILILLQKEGWKSGVVALCVRQRCVCARARWFHWRPMPCTVRQPKRNQKAQSAAEANGKKRRLFHVASVFTTARCTKRHKLRSANRLPPPNGKIMNLSREATAFAPSQSDRTVSIGACRSDLKLHEFVHIWRLYNMLHEIEMFVPCALQM